MRQLMVVLLALASCACSLKFQGSLLAPMNRPEGDAAHVTEEAIVVADILRTQGEAEAMAYLLAKGHEQNAAERILLAVKTACKCTKEN